jgi:hypothetical protein
VQEHLAICEMCAHEYEFEATVLEQLKGKLRKLDAPADLMGRISRVLGVGC